MKLWDEESEERGERDRSGDGGECGWTRSENIVSGEEAVRWRRGRGGGGESRGRLLPAYKYYGLNAILFYMIILNIKLNKRITICNYTQNFLENEKDGHGLDWSTTAGNERVWNP